MRGTTKASSTFCFFFPPFSYHLGMSVNKNVLLLYFYNLYEKSRSIWDLYLASYIQLLWPIRWLRVVRGTDFLRAHTLQFCGFSTRHTQHAHNTCTVLAYSKAGSVVSHIQNASSFYIRYLFGCKRFTSRQFGTITCLWRTWTHIRYHNTAAYAQTITKYEQ